MKILILTGKFGMGHNSVALSLKSQILNDEDDAIVEVIDVMDYMCFNLQYIIYYWFNFIVKNGSAIYNTCYTITNNKRKFKLSWLFSPKLESILNEGVSLIISTLPISTQIISEYKRKNKVKAPLITVITDIGVHNLCISDNIDMYIVPSGPTKIDLMHKNISEDKIRITRMPLKEEFFQKNLELIIKSNKKKILIMGGGLGLIPLKDRDYKMLNKLEGVEIVVIFGSNKRGYMRLQNKYKNIKVIGHTDHVAQYMKNSALIITKAGGITLFEAISSEIPLLILYPKLEQEKSNAVFINKNNIGKVIWKDSRNIAVEIYNLISDENKLWEIKNNMYKMNLQLGENSIVDVINSKEYI